jgi:hypothetical protein
MYKTERAFRVFCFIWFVILRYCFSKDNFFQKKWATACLAITHFFAKNYFLFRRTAEKGLDADGETENIGTI